MRTERKTGSWGQGRGINDSLCSLAELHVLRPSAGVRQAGGIYIMPLALKGSAFAEKLLEDSDSSKSYYETLGR